MKYLFYSFISIFCLIPWMTAQEKIDNVWLFGSNTGSLNPLFQGSLVDFNGEISAAIPQQVGIRMDFANASICDEEGNLLFYTNGRYVSNAEHEVMENGNNLNAEFTIGSDQYLITIQGTMILPVPENPSRYYIFHLGLIPVFPDGILDVSSSPFFYSVVSFNNPFYPLGEVVEKNTMITNDTLDLGKIVATRHANGRDWWIVLSKRDTNEHYRFLVSPEGVVNIGTQSTGTFAQEGFGQAAFSPDGTRYAKVSLHQGESYINLYDFDRCTGELSNQQQYFFTDLVGAAGLVISPNSQFLYFIKPTQIIQFDMEAADIWATADTVAIYDGYQEEVITSNQDTAYVSTTFFLGQLGPDNKIYINATNSVSSLTVVNSPDLQGDACDVVQRGLDLPALNRFSLPNFPNYRLGRLEGSPCDTLDFTDVVEKERQQRELELIPNPASSYFTFMNTGRGVVWHLSSISGQVLLSGVTSDDDTRVDVSNLNAGLYFLTVENQTVKVLVQR